MKVGVIYDPLLRTKVAPVTVFEASLKTEADQMLKVMHAHNGIGLAANQVGLNKQLIVYGFTPDPKDSEQAKVPAIAETALVNPKIVKTSRETVTVTEGCLSLPGLELPVTRPVSVVVEAQKLGGQKITVKAKGLQARILQHEIDHLNGVLFTDRAEKGQNLSSYAGAKIVFFGSDEFSRPVLTGLRQAGLNVIAAVCETDKRSGRGKTVTVPIVKSIAGQEGLAVFQPIDKAEIVSLLTQLQPDLVVLASYGKILPDQALQIPTYGALNVHPSLLPKYRGATPIQTAILNGDKESGVTVMKMNAGVDTGEIVSQQVTAIKPDETFLSLRQKLATAGTALVLKTIPDYLAGQAKLKAQAGQTSQTSKLTKEMGRINWDSEVETIDRQIRAFNPWPGSYTELDGQNFKILEAKLVGSKLLPQTVQLEGKKAAAWTDFQHGYAERLKNQPWWGKIA